MMRALLLFMFITSALAVTACEEGGGNLEIVNGTPTTVHVYTLGDHTGLSIAPGERTSVGTLISDWPNSVVATNDLGQEIFSKSYTWSEIDGFGLTILFTCSSKTPAPTRADVVAVQC
jgi:hypothetical protein